MELQFNFHKQAALKRGAGLTEALSGDCAEEAALLAVRGAVAGAQCGLRRAGDAVGLGGARAGMAGRMTGWGKRRR